MGTEMQANSHYEDGARNALRLVAEELGLDWPKRVGTMNATAFGFAIRERHDRESRTMERSGYGKALIEMRTQLDKMDTQ